MTTTNYITYSTMNMNIYNNIDQTITPKPELLNKNSPNICIPTKVCKTYRTIKYITEFYKNKSRYDGYPYICKICNKLQKQEYVERNKDKVAERKNKYYEQNKNKILKNNKEYYELHKDKLTEYQKEYRKINKNIIAQKMKNYRDLHKDKIILHKKLL